MASTRTTFTIDEELVQHAHALGINLSAAAREGVAAAVRSALAEADRRAYARRPEQADPFWIEGEGWTKE